MTEWIISASVLTATVILLRLIFRKRISRFMQYALWSIVLLRLLIPFSVLSSPISVANVFGANTAAPQLQTVSAPQRSGEAAKNIYISDEAPADTESASNVTDAKKASVPAKSLGTKNILMLIWLAGGAVTGAWLLCANIMFSRRLRRSRRPVDIPGCRLRIFISDSIASPCLFGLFRPAIYLTPKAAADGTEHVIAHELCHYRHGDHIWTLLRCVCIAVWWWNPLVWAAAFMSRTDSELACDEAAIRLIGEDNRLAYGRTLIDMIAVRRTASDIICTATTMASGKRGLTERIEMITKNPKRIISSMISVLLIAALCAGCTFTGANVPAASEHGLYVLIECDTPVYSIGWSADGNSGGASLADNSAYSKGDRILVTDEFDGQTEYSITVSGKDGEKDTLLTEGYFSDDFSNDASVELVLAADMSLLHSESTVTYSASKIDANGTVTQIVSPLSGAGKRLAEDIIMDAMVKSAAFEGRDVSELTDGWIIKESYADGESHDYYAYIITDGEVVNGAVLQSGADNMYTRIDDSLYQKFTDYMEMTITETGGADQPQSISQTASYQLADMRIDDSDNYTSIISDFLKKRDGKAPNELWLCEALQDADNTQGCYILAQCYFDSEVVPELYYISDGAVQAYTEGSDAFAVNYTVHNGHTIIYGPSFASAVRSITADFADKSTVTAQIKVPISEIELRLKNSAHKSCAREYFILADSKGAAPNSISALTDDGRTVFPSADGNIFKKQSMINVTRIDRTNPASVAVGFLSAYFDKLCTHDSDLEWDSGTSTWLNGLVSYQEPFSDNIAILRQWIEYNSFLAEDGYDPEQSIGRFSSITHYEDGVIAHTSIAPVDASLDVTFKTTAFTAQAHFFMLCDDDGNYTVESVDFPDWREYNEFYASFTDYMQKNSYIDYNKSIYIDYLRQQRDSAQ